MSPDDFSEWVNVLRVLLDVLGVPVALAIAIGGWLLESRYRRKSERERAAAVRREVYFEVASTLHDYLVARERLAEFEYWRILPKLALVSPKPVRLAAVRVTAARASSSEKERRDAMDGLIHAMECDLEGERLPLAERVLFGAVGE